TGSKIEQPGGRPMHLFGLPPDTETSANPGPWEHGAHRAMFGPAPGAPRQVLTGLSDSHRDTLARCRRGRSRFAALLRAWASWRRRRAVRAKTGRLRQPAGVISSSGRAADS